MSEPLSKSYVNTHDPNHPVQEDLVLYQLFEKARKEGHVGEIVNLETGTRHLTTDLLDKADEYAKGLLAIGYTPGEDNLAVLGCSTVEAFCMFIAATSIGAGFGQPYTYDPKELSISRTVSLLQCKAVVVGEGSSGVVFSALVNLFEDTETPQSEKLPFVKHVFYDNTHRARTLQQKYIKPLDKLKELGESITDGQLMAARKLVKPDFVVHHIFTSGSTGEPKCVAHTHKCLVNEMQVLTISNDEPMLCISANIDEMIAYMCVGWTFSGQVSKTTFIEDIIEESAFERMVKNSTQAILDEGVKHIVLPGPVVQLIVLHIKSNNIELPPVKSFVIGGQLVSRQFMENLQNVLKGRLFNVYGTSETATIAMSTFADSPEDEEARLGCRLYPKVNSELRLVDGNNQIVDIGKDGEIQVKSFSIFKGYVMGEEKTKEMLTDDGFVKTGDMAVMYPDGSFNIKGRRADAIRFKVFTDVVYPGPIEMVIGKYSPFADVSVVAGKPSDVMGDEVTYCIRLKNPSEKPTEEEVLEFCKDNGLSELQSPARLIYLDHFPATANARKVSKKLLRELVLNLIKEDPDAGITEWYKEFRDGMK